MPATARNANLHAAATGNPAVAQPGNIQFQPLQMAIDGALYVSVTAQAAGPGGDSEPVSFDAYAADAIPPSFNETGGMVVSAGLRALNAAGNVDRARFLATDADAQVAAQLGLLGSVARAQRFNGATWDRARALASDTDAQVAAQLGLTGAVMRPQIFNGVTYDRQRAPVSFAGTSATAAGLNAIVAGIAGQRIRLLRYSLSLSNQSASATGNITATIADGAALTGLLHVFGAPAATTAAEIGLSSPGWIDLGPIGFLGAVGAALNLNLSAALTAGAFSIVVAYIQGAAP